MATVIKGSDTQGTSYAGTTGGFQSQSEPGMTEKAREKASELGTVAKEKAVGQLDTAKGQLCSIITNVADGLDRAGREVEGPAARVFEMGSRYARQACDRINASSAQELLNDVGEQLRSRPAVFLGALVGAGFLAGRMLKS